jgi:hypothetical protein
MLSDWITLSVAAGYDVGRLSHEQLSVLYGRIIRDSALRNAALKKLVGSVLPSSARVQVLNEMNAAQRSELRRRILEN